MTTAIESDSSLPQTCKSGTNETGDILHHAVFVCEVTLCLYMHAIYVNERLLC